MGIAVVDSSGITVIDNLTIRNVGNGVFVARSTLVITSNTTLTQDHYGSVIVVADNVVLDATGHTIFGPGGPETDGGIDVGHLSGVTIKNAIVTGFVHGIKIVDSSQVTVTGARAYGNSNGFYISGTSNSRFTGNTSQAVPMHRPRHL
jgi:parallel beta-helix repeat protein